MNRIFFQFFHAHPPSSVRLWNHCREQVSFLKALGVSHVWLPPAFRLCAEDDGLTYDLYEFGDADGSARYGTRDDYFACVRALRDRGIAVIAEVVLDRRCSDAAALPDAGAQPVDLEPHFEELKQWGEWYHTTTGVDGFRLDGLERLPPRIPHDWLDHMNRRFSRDFLAFGGYRNPRIEALLHYLDATHHRIQLLDLPLQANFRKAAALGADFDLRTIFEETLVQKKPWFAITFVDNHETQAQGGLEPRLADWFQPIAHALILLREAGTPCVFYPAVYGARYQLTREGREHDIRLPHDSRVEKMMKVRRRQAHGHQQDYFDDPHVVGWTRHGRPDDSITGFAVVASNQGDAEKRMHMGIHNKNKRLKDVTGGIEDSVVLDGNGDGIFPVRHRTASVWVDEDLMI